MDEVDKVDEVDRGGRGLSSRSSGCCVDALCDGGGFADHEWPARGGVGGGWAGLEDQRTRSHYFFVLLGTPPVDPRRQGSLPPEGTKWFDFDITGQQRRGGNTDLGLSIATPPGRRRESGCDFVKATAPIRRISRTMQSFGCLRLDTRTYCARRHGGEGAFRKRERSVSECSPLQGGPWQGTCPPFFQGSQGSGWGAIGGRGCFHSMVLENKAEGRKSRAAGRRRNLGESGLGDRHIVCLCVCVPVCLCACVSVCLCVDRKGNAQNQKKIRASPTIIALDHHIRTSFILSIDLRRPPCDRHPGVVSPRPESGRGIRFVSRRDEPWRGVGREVLTQKSQSV